MWPPSALAVDESLDVAVGLHNEQEAWDHPGFLSLLSLSLCWDKLAQLVADCLSDLVNPWGLSGSSVCSQEAAARTKTILNGPQYQSI